MYMRKEKLKKAFTLMELMVSAALLLVIMAAIVPQFRAIRNSWATTQDSSVKIQNGLVLDEHLNRNLTTASQITAVSSSEVGNGFITFKDNLGATQKYMVEDGYIVFGPVGHEEQLAGPVSKFQISCYSLNDLENPMTDVSRIRLVKIETEITNSDSQSSANKVISEVFIQTNKSTISDQNVIDIIINPDQPDTAYDYTEGDHGCDAVIEIEKNSTQGLLCFKGIVGNASWQIPQNTEITEAKLELWCVNHNGNHDVYIYRMNVGWTETSTWNNIGGGIIPGTNCDSMSVVTANLGNSVPTSVEIDVTEIVRGWINGDYPNFGFGFINSKNNSLQFAAAENRTGTGAHTPRLIISYQSTDNNPKIALKNTLNYGGSHGIIDSYNSSAGFYGGSNISHNAVVTSNAIGSDIITLYSGGRIYGDAYIGPGGNPAIGFSTWGSTITGEEGTLDEAVDLPTPTAPTGHPFHGWHEGDFPSNDWLGGERILNSNHYFNSISIWSSYITINGNITVLLNNDLNIGSGRSIRIPPGSSLNLYVKGNCNIGGDINSFFDRLPSNLKIYMIGNNKSFSTWGTGNVYALLDNPNGSVSLWGGQFYGRIKAKYLSGGCKIHVDLDSNFGSGGGSPSRLWTFGGNIIQGEILP
ncbi:MAG: hypothetical protein A2Y10_12000 [Planctomycetes bacterium GWF2_41_51]|nr:MAG: hypothetical protein A2Y10_12000 [Planctomycetes bacterium GWF2_41_51]HBG28668.1 hypothetical protein [Phycisphaerales bacterium]